MPIAPSNWVPKRCVYEATLACNLRCRHCGSSAGTARPDELTTDEAADMFAQLAALGCRRVVISGGEPMLRADWPELVNAAARTGMRVGMITNATLFDERAAGRARDAGLTTVGFSIDGVGRTHDLVRGRMGHFETNVGAMRAARGAGLPFAVVTHVNRINMGELQSIKAFVGGEGAYAWQIQLGADMGNMRESGDLMIRPRDAARVERDLAQLIREGGLRILPADSVGYFGPNERTLRRSIGARRFPGCMAGINVVGVESNGNVKGCLSIQAGYNPRGCEWVEGNVRTERLADIWHRPGAFAYNREWTIESLTGFCRRCEHAAQCRGGCRSNMAASGDGGENPYCAHRALVEEGSERPRAGKVAAMLLASVIGASAQACKNVPVYGIEDTDTLDAGDDAGLDAGADADGDTDVDTATGTAYAIPDTDGM